MAVWLALNPCVRSVRRTRSHRSEQALPSVEVARLFSRRLRGWYRRHGRDLPWRHTRDPYRILVSELMLQQTPVSRVLEYYDRFMERFPTLYDVAMSPRREVMEAWEGLGYYARARHLHRLARDVTRADPTARLPREPNELRALPGVGAYTAGAVSSFAYERRAALVDTNVGRVLRRVFAPRLAPHTTRGARRIWEIAEALLPNRGSTAWWHNQAVMELGAMICTARVMYCQRCPVRRVCATYAKTGDRRPETGASQPQRGAR